MEYFSYLPTILTLANFTLTHAMERPSTPPAITQVNQAEEKDPNSTLQMLCDGVQGGATATWRKIQKYYGASALACQMLGLPLRAESTPEQWRIDRATPAHPAHDEWVKTQKVWTDFTNLLTKAQRNSLSSKEMGSLAELQKQIGDRSLAALQITTALLVYSDVGASGHESPANQLFFADLLLDEPTQNFLAAPLIEQLRQFIALKHSEVSLSLDGVRAPCSSTSSVSTTASNGVTPSTLTAQSLQLFDKFTTSEDGDALVVSMPSTPPFPLDPPPHTALPIQLLLSEAQPTVLASQNTQPPQKPAKPKKR